MRRVILIMIVFSILSSCRNKDPKSENLIQKIAEDTLSKTLSGTADVPDEPVKNNKQVKKIQKQLRILLRDELPKMKEADRYFYYEAFDLNNDKKNEYFVGFSTPYFCGSGGCSGYILNNNGSLITDFTLTYFPIYVTTTRSEKFYDLIMESGGTFRHIKFKDRKYPSNPAVQPEHTGDFPKGSVKVLDIEGKKLERYSF
jgi:hypothetical protein